MGEHKMPEPVRLGEILQTTVGHAMHMRGRDDDYGTGNRRVMGFQLPTWQRPLVWTEAQMVRFMESVWLGLPIGTYSYNQVIGHPALDGLLIDGQQRMFAIQKYLDDAFPVFGWRWSEVTKPDRRRLEMSTSFPCYITKSTDENYLRSYYDMMNFGGVAHTEDQRATRGN